MSLRSWIGEAGGLNTQLGAAGAFLTQTAVPHWLTPHLGPRMMCSDHSGACMERPPRSREESCHLMESLVWGFTLSKNYTVNAPQRSCREETPKRSCRQETCLTLFKPGIRKVFCKGPDSEYLRFCRPHPPVAPSVVMSKQPLSLPKSMFRLSFIHGQEGGWIGPVGCN